MKCSAVRILALGLMLGCFTLGRPSATQAQAAKAASPKQQLADFYALCKQGKPAKALVSALSKSKSIKADDAQRVADSFAKMMSGMGDFLDYEITKETPISKRLVVIRCVAHFTEQPFVNEFTFYNPSGNEWRIVHLRYDANLATMFGPELSGR